MRLSRVSESDDLVVVRNLAADEPGIAALRHDRRRRLVGEAEDLRNLGDRGGPQHHRRAAAEHVAHLEEIRRLHLRVGDGVFLADDRGEAREQGRINSGGRFIEHQGAPVRLGC